MLPGLCQTDWYLTYKACQAWFVLCQAPGYVNYGEEGCTPGSAVSCAVI